MGEKKEVFTDCTLCYHSCGTRVTIEDGRATKIRGLESHPVNKGRLCPKGANALDVIYSPDRLKLPLKRSNGGFEEISWDRALDEIAQKLIRLKEEFGPQVLAMFCGSIGVENLEMSTLIYEASEPPRNRSYDTPTSKMLRSIFAFRDREFEY